jgi:hypothetical protein
MSEKSMMVYSLDEGYRVVDGLEWEMNAMSEVRLLREKKCV